MDVTGARKSSEIVLRQSNPRVYPISGTNKNTYHVKTGAGPRPRDKLSGAISERPARPDWICRSRNEANLTKTTSVCVGNRQYVTQLIIVTHS